MLNKLWVRLTKRDKYQNFMFWNYLMFWGTAAPGVAFVFFGDTKTVNATVLWQLTVVHGGGMLVSLWGLGAIAAVLMALGHMLCRKRWMGVLASRLGYVVWFYAFAVYAMGNYWLQANTAFIWLYFWGVHDTRVRRYYKELHAGEIELPN